MENEPRTWKYIETHYLSAIESPWYQLLTKLENLVSLETILFFSKRGLITLHLPITTGSISSPMGRGSDSLPVSINLFGVQTYLADSMQFLLEYGCRFNRVGCYYVMPSFRGEKADERHLNQFYHSEAEIGGTLEDVMLLCEEYIRHLAVALLDKLGGEIKQTIGDIHHIERIAKDNKPFQRISFSEATRLFVEKFGTHNEYLTEHEGWRTITNKGERALIALCGSPVWLTHHDYLSVPFYQKMDKIHHGTAMNADLLMGIGETIGCGERHNNTTELRESLQIHQVSPAAYEWYITMKEKFPMQTAGFGMGIERFLMWVLKGTDIRDFQICPRFNGVNIVP